MTSGLDVFAPTPDGLAQPMDGWEARRRLARVNEHVEQMLPDVIALYRGRAWISLGYESWQDMCAAEISVGLQLRMEQRQAAVSQLTDAGMSTRAIAGTLGVHHSTVADDLRAGVGNPTPGTVTGLDGKTYPRNPITPEAAQAADDVMAQPFTADDFTEEPEDEATPRPHVTNNSGNNEWYTPKDLIDAATELFFDDYCPESLNHEMTEDGCDCPPITTDPASSDLAQATVQAKYYYTADTDGLAQEWRGNVWLNPPYSQPLLSRFIDKLLTELDAGRVRQALVLVNNATETGWAQRLIEASAAVCFLKGRVKYLDVTGRPANTPLQGQMVVFLPGAPYHEWWQLSDYGSDRPSHVADLFCEAFGALGQVVVR